MTTKMFVVEYTDLTPKEERFVRSKTNYRLELVSNDYTFMKNYVSEEGLENLKAEQESFGIMDLRIVKTIILNDTKVVKTFGKQVKGLNFTNVREVAKKELTELIKDYNEGFIENKELNDMGYEIIVENNNEGMTTYGNDDVMELQSNYDGITSKGFNA